MVALKILGPVVPCLQARAEPVQENDRRRRSGSGVADMQSDARDLDERRRRLRVFRLERGARGVGGVKKGAGADNRHRGNGQCIPQPCAHLSSLTFRPNPWALVIDHDPRLRARRGGRSPGDGQRDIVRPRAI